MSRILRILTLTAALAVTPLAAAAQKVSPPVPPVSRLPVSRAKKYDGPQEKAVAVSSDVNLTLCVLRGKLSVNSWDRNEVRVFTAEGSKFEFRVLQKDASGSPVWISVNAVSELQAGMPVPTDCLDTDDIEIDAPKGTSLTVKGRDLVLRADSINSVSVVTFSGDVELRNIGDGISASVNRSSISIGDSAGAISVETTTGDILAFGLKAKKPGDSFRAKSLSGSVALINVGHRQLDGGTISGAVSFTGPIRAGGVYRFSSQNGNVRLNLPKDSSATISATYGAGGISSGFALKVLTEDLHEGPVKSVVATIGTPGDSVVKITTTRGDIQLRPLGDPAKPED